MTKSCPLKKEGPRDESSEVKKLLVELGCSWCLESGGFVEGGSEGEREGGREGERNEGRKEEGAGSIAQW
jgi:hypothetical protein